jgi:hypothetical protein
MHPKVQHGPGSGNQSDDEMAFMCYYGLLRCSQDDNLKTLIESGKRKGYLTFAQVNEFLPDDAVNVFITLSARSLQINDDHRARRIAIDGDQTVVRWRQ